MTRGATIFGVEGLALSGDERRFYAEADPFGFILFARNVDTPDQLRRLTDNLRAAVMASPPKPLLHGFTSCPCMAWGRRRHCSTGYSTRPTAPARH